jgi:3-hydroxyisobutyrate dehydrogenase-like beta-hydroxyacid dehydrogenase
MAKNLIQHSGKKLLVWNRTRSKAEAFASQYPGQCDVADTPREVVSSCRVTYSMLSTPDAALDVFYDESGVLEGVGPGKVIVGEFCPAASSTARLACHSHTRIIRLRHISGRGYD